MRTELLTESTAQELRLHSDQARRLEHLGRSLASNTDWWGVEPRETRTPSSVIRCRPLSGDRYEVRVSDAIGAVGLGDLQLLVQPKIPMRHLLYLLREADQLPRTDDDSAELEPDATFFSLVARWYLIACERLLRRDLIRDYEPVTADLQTVRGKIHPVATVKSLLSGRPSVRCGYEHFGVDNPLNRVLAAASRVLSATPSIPSPLRRRSRRIYARLGGVGELRPTDIRSVTDARSLHYRDAHSLALRILIGHGTSTQAGKSPAWTFLFRTPEPVEEGIRTVLQRHLSHTWGVRKRGRALLGAKRRTLNPDLVFGNEAVDADAVGDVKFRLSTGRIKTDHLYQLTAFAAGYHAPRAVLIEFGSGDETDHVEVGDYRVDSFSWDIHMEDPEDAGRQLATHLEQWLATELAA